MVRHLIKAPLYNATNIFLVVKFSFVPIVHAMQLAPAMAQPMLPLQISTRLIKVIEKLKFMFSKKDPKIDKISPSIGYYVVSVK